MPRTATPPAPNHMPPVVNLPSESNNIVSATNTVLNDEQPLTVKDTQTATEEPFVDEEETADYDNYDDDDFSATLDDLDKMLDDEINEFPENVATVNGGLDMNDEPLQDKLAVDELVDSKTSSDDESQNLKVNGDIHESIEINNGKIDENASIEEEKEHSQQIDGKDEQIQPDQKIQPNEDVSTSMPESESSTAESVNHEAKNADKTSEVDMITPEVGNNIDSQHLETLEDNSNQHITSEDDMNKRATSEDDLNQHITSEDSLNQHITAEDDLNQQITSEDDLNQNVTSDDDLIQHQIEETLKTIDVHPSKEITVNEIKIEDDSKNNFVEEVSLTEETTKQQNIEEIETN